MKLDQPLHIIIDGADGLGKTTLVQKLGRILQLPVIKMPNMKEYIEKGTAEEFSRLFNETIVQFSEFDFILDRGFTSSLVYSKVNKREDNLQYIESIENILKPHVFIISGVDDYGYFKPVRSDEIYDLDVLSKVDVEFVRLAQKQGYSILRTWQHSPDQMIKFIYDQIHEPR